MKLTDPKLSMITSAKKYRVNILNRRWDTSTCKKPELSILIKSLLTIGPI